VNDGYIPRDIYPWAKDSSGALRESRTKSLKMDEISDLPASGLLARSSQVIRQVSSTSEAGEVARVRSLRADAFVAADRVARLLKRPRNDSLG